MKAMHWLPYASMLALIGYYFLSRLPLMIVPLAPFVWLWGLCVLPAIARRSAKYGYAAGGVLVCWAFAYLVFLFVAPVP